jgi:hypothetical protein
MNRIDVVCDGPHRARGKVAKVVSFTLCEGGMWLGPFYLRGGRLVPARPLHGYRAENAGVIRPNVVGQRGATTQRYGCAFCRQKLECSDETLQWLLNTVAAQGESKPTLRLLNMIVSRRGQ